MYSLVRFSGAILALTAAVVAVVPSPPTPSTPQNANGASPLDGMTFPIFPKKLSGGPSEFVDHMIPQATEVFQSESSIFQEFDLTSETMKAIGRGSTDGVVSYPITVDSTVEAVVGFMSPLLGEYSISFTGPDGNTAVDVVELPDSVFPLSSDGSVNVNAVTYQIVPNSQYPDITGTWEINFTPFASTVEALKNRKRSTGSNDAVLIVRNVDSVSMVTSLVTFDLSLNSHVGLQTYVADGGVVANSKTRPTPLRPAAARVSSKNAAVEPSITISQAQLSVQLPDGSSVWESMFDDGLHDDAVANDGIYGAFVIGSVPGTYVAQAYLEGTTATGAVFQRSTQHVIQVSDDNVALGTQGYVTPSVLPDKIDVFVSVSQALQTSYLAFCQLYGTDSTTNSVSVPVAWIGGVSTVIDGTIGFEVDLNYVNRSGASDPYMLNQCFLQDINTSVLLSSQPTVALSDSFYVTKMLARLKAQPKLGLLVPDATTVTDRMRMGAVPAGYVALQKQRQKIFGAGLANATLLVHGYCTTVNPWSANAALFKNNPYFYLDGGQSLTNQEFALRVYNYITAKPVQYFVGIGHSQGGLALLHLFNYYWSGLDFTASRADVRLIQSIGSPFQGSSGAGSAMKLAKVFGVGCGTNYDLTPEGATQWLAGISTASRSKVHYYTTTYKLGNLFGDSCSAVTNLVLKWPNDGVVEKDNAQLPSGVNRGNVEKQCHSTGMNYPAQYLDNTRNAVFNSFTKI